MSNSVLSEKENVRLVLEGKQPEWIPNYIHSFQRVFTTVGGRKMNPETGIKTDAFGVKFKPTPEGDVPLHTITREYRLEDICEWESVMPQIDLDSVDWKWEADRMKSLVPEGKAMDFFAGWIWDQLVFLMGYEGAFMALCTEPEECAKCLSAISDFYISVMKRVCQYVKPDMIMLMDHICTHKGPLISPKTYREVIKPADKKFFEAIHEIGSIAEIHTDGDIGHFMPDFAEMGVQAIQPFQIYNDINAAKEKYGFIAVGGWDAFGPGNQNTSTVEQSRESVRLAMDSYGKTCRYIFWSSGALAERKENTAAIQDEARKYGHSFYNK